jgi:hypothetical protein
MAKRLCLIILSAFLASPAAGEEPGADDYVRIARLSYITGHVSFQHASDVDWSAASINLPVLPEDRIYTGADGRAEIEFDDGSVYRLAENTDVEVLSLSENLVQLRILVGLTTLTVSSGLDFEINTPAAAFNARRKGVYRFSVAENGQTEAIVRKGELEAANNEFSRTIEDGEILRIAPGQSDTGSLARYDRRDNWDEWNDRREADRKAYASRRYLPDSVYVGVSELDRYGRWVNIDAYGSAWIPYYVDTYWSPYSSGRWCYRPYFGWTWISYEPWGWLPYHYGRWHRSSIFGWCWLPGPGFSFNFWSPGLVSFYYGPGWISWCPLGPGDYYNINHYRYHRGIYSYQLSQLRALHTRRPGDLFNRDARGAFRTADINHFRDDSFGDRNRGGRWRNVDQPWRQGTQVNDRLPIEPTAASRNAAPGRSIARPGVNNSLPAVVRTPPQVSSGSRDRFTRITNPQITSFSSRNRPAADEAGVSGSGNMARPGSRVTRIQSADQNAPNANNGVRANPGTRTITNPRGSANLENDGQGAQGQRRSAPAARPGNRDTSAPRNQAGSSTGRTFPEGNPSRQPSGSVTAPGRPQNNGSTPLPGTGAGRSGSGAPPARTPESRSSTIYTVPRQNYSGQSFERAAPQRSQIARPSFESRQQSNYSAPRTAAGSARSYSGSGITAAPQVQRTYAYSAPRQSNTFSGGQRSGLPRSMSAPSFGRSGGGFGSSSVGRSGGGRSAGRSQSGGGRR